MKRLTIRDVRGGINCTDLGAALNKLADCEDAEEQGRLVRLPVKVGDAVYQTDSVRVYENEVKNIVFDTDGIAFDESAIGKSVFLTREEAEAAQWRRVCYTRPISQN